MGTMRWALLLLWMGAVCGQNFDNAQPQQQFPLQDPIRRALGLWGRLLNRMAQPYQSTTDEELHLRDKNDRPIFDVDSLPSLFQFTTIRPKGGAASIIDEMRLNQLLPRIHEETTTPPPTTSTSTTTTTTTTSTTTTTTTTSKPTTTTTVAKKKETTPKPSTTTAKPSTTTTEAEEEETTKAAQRTELKASVRVVEGNKTVEVKSKTTKVVEKAKDEERAIQSTSASPTTTRSTKTTKPPTTTRPAAQDDPTAATPVQATAAKGTKAPAKAKTTPLSTTPPPPTTAAAQSDEEGVEGSGEDESVPTSESADSMQNDDSESSSLESDYVIPLSGANSKKAAPKATTLSPKSKLLAAKKEQAKAKSAADLENIPEAEEEATEFQSDERPFSTTIAPEQTVSTTKNPMANFYENSMKVEKLMNPVSSIIDGIGPLILPLLGFPRQAAAAAVVPAAAAAARPAVAGVRTFKPQQIRSNGGVGGEGRPQRRLHKAYGGPKEAIKKQANRPPLPEPSAFPPASSFGAKPYASESGAFVGGAGAQKENENARFLPDPPQADRDTRTALIRQLLARQGIVDANLSDQQMSQIAQLAQQLPQGKKEFVGISPAAPAPQPVASPRRTVLDDQDPGYQRGRTMVNTFYEDSGLMVQPDAAPAAATTAGSGFGGGRRPSGDFEQALLSPDDSAFSFI